MLKNLDEMTRDQLELEIIFWDIAPLDPKSLRILEALSTEQLRELVRQWVLDGDDAAADLPRASHVCIHCGRRSR